MVGFLGFLLIILVVVFINSQTPPPKKASEIAPAAQPPVQNTVSTTAPPPQVIATAVPVASASAQDLTVQLTGTTDSANTLQPMQLDFTKQGFKSVLVNSQTVAASETIVTFSDRTSPETKQQVINVVQKYAPNPVVQQKADALNDISIIVGK